MREFLDDVHEHMDDGYGRAQAHTKTELRKRFYTDVSADEIEGGFAINLDGRPTKTPGMQKIIVSSRRLAELMVAEWSVQKTHIDPRTMPIVRLVNSAIEGGEDVASALREEVLNFAGNDLLLFRAESPKELVALQNEQWDGLLVKLEKHFGVLFEPVQGIIHRAQPEKTLTRIAQDMDSANFLVGTCLVSITGLTGSALIALALRHGLIEADAGWSIAHVDEDYNASNWGVDPEAVARRDKRKIEYDAALKVLALVDEIQVSA